MLTKRQATTEYLYHLPDHPLPLLIPRLMLTKVQVTTEYLYHMPDHPLLLQSFSLQHEDIWPELPKLYDFVEYWKKNLEGPLKEVSYCCFPIDRSAFRPINAEFKLH